MQTERTTIHSLSDDLLRYMASNFLDPREALKLSQVCKQYRKISECKIIWKEIGKRISQDLLITEHTIVPEDKENTLTVQEYKDRIRTNTHALVKEIETILLKIFPSVQMPKDKPMFNPAYFSPYLENLKKNAANPHSWASTQNKADSLYFQLKAFLEGSNLHPRIFLLFIENLSTEDIFVIKLIEELNKIINTYDTKKLMDWIETAKQCRNMGSNSVHANNFNIFLNITSTVALGYINSYSTNTLEQQNLVKNDTAFTCFLSFLESLIDDTLFLTHFQPAVTLLDPLETLTMEEKKQIFDNVKYIITEYKLKSL